MSGIKDLLDNEKGVLAVLVLIAATVLAVLGKLSIGDWKDMTTAIFGLYAGATALHASAQAFAQRGQRGLPKAEAKPEAKPEVKS